VQRNQNSTSSSIAQWNQVTRWQHDCNHDCMWERDSTPPRSRKRGTCSVKLEWRMCEDRGVSQENMHCKYIAWSSGMRLLRHVSQQRRAQRSRADALVHPETFMILSRIAKNCAGFRGLVKKSAKLAEDGTYGTTSSPFSMHSRT
jgi:hypothetical protein